MEYTERLAKYYQQKFNISNATVRRWKRMNHIPDNLEAWHSAPIDKDIEKQVITIFRLKALNIDQL